MDHEVRWDPRVPDAVRTEAMPERKRLVGRILSLGDTPLPPGHHVLKTGSPEKWVRLDEGRFTLLYTVDGDAKVVKVYAVLKDGHLLNAAAYQIDA